MNSNLQGRTGKTLVGVTALVLVASMTAACGSSSAGSASGASAEAHKSATEVLADAKSALFNAKSVHVVGSLTAGGQTIDLQLQGEDASGTLVESGLTVKIVNVSGVIYLNAPAAFLAKTGGSSAAALGGKWIKVTAAQSGVAAQLTLQGIAANLTTNDSPLNPTTSTTTVDGQRAIVLTQKDGSQFFVTDSATPLPLKLVNKGTKASSITFSDYGKTQSITAPAGAVTPQQAVSAEASPTA